MLKEKKRQYQSAVKARMNCEVDFSDDEVDYSKKLSPEKAR
jgi:hypothetical protein